jgi:hypothetical protein
MNNKENYVPKDLGQLRSYVASQILDSLLKRVEISLQDNPSLSEVSSYEDVSVHDFALEGIYYAFSNYIEEIIDGLPDDKRNSIDSKEFKNYLRKNKIFEISEQEGGGEGGAEECHAIMKVGDRYFLFEYAYYSHHGYDIFESNKVIEVKPRQVEVTKFFPA